MLKVKDKNVTHEEKVKLYCEFLEIMLVRKKNYKTFEESSEGKTTDVLLSILPGLIAKMNEITEMTRTFKPKFCACK